MRQLLLLALILAAGCSGRIEKDKRPSFQIDLSQPFRIEFGRGSGWDGLDTVKIDQTGRVVVHRQRWEQRGGISYPLWDTATLQLSPDALG